MNRKRFLQLGGMGALGASFSGSPLLSSLQNTSTIKDTAKIAVQLYSVRKEIEKDEAEIAKVEQKLANPNFTQKVPPQVLLEHQQRLAEWQGKRDHAKSALDALEG